MMKLSKHNILIIVIIMPDQYKHVLSQPKKQISDTLIEPSLIRVNNCFFILKFLSLKIS